jgi:hypothetical protein
MSQLVAAEPTKQAIGPLRPRAVERAVLAAVPRRRARRLDSRAGRCPAKHIWPRPLGTSRFAVIAPCGSSAPIQCSAPSRPPGSTTASKARCAQ